MKNFSKRSNYFVYYLSMYLNPRPLMFVTDVYRKIQWRAIENKSHRSLINTSLFIFNIEIEYFSNIYSHNLKELCKKSEVHLPSN